MFPHRRMPSHLTVLYIYSIVSLVALFHATLVAAEVVVVSPENRTVQVFIDYELSIAARVPTGGIEGMIVTANPIDACDSIWSPPYSSNSSLKWFVLIERSTCSMRQQVLMAQKAGYDAAVIYNKGINSLQQVNSERRVTVDGSNQDISLVSTLQLSYSTLESQITIPAILIGEHDGDDIKNLYLYNKGYILILYPDQTFNLNKYLLPIASIIGVCFIIMLLLMVIKCIKDRRKNQRNRLSSKHLKQLPVKKFKKGDPYDVCAICLEDYKEGEKLRILPCSHAYHTKCVDPWLTKNRHTCPVCKRKVILEGHQCDSDSDSDHDSSEETTPLLHPIDRQSNTSSVGGTFSEPMPTPLYIQANQAGLTRIAHDEETTQTTAVPPEPQTTQVELHHSTETVGTDLAPTSLYPAAHHSVNGDRPEQDSVENRSPLQGAKAKKQLELVV
ncbi:E3 ubiquitin-protein ligase RNF13-like isoform X1 [Limulus polyphemus]|uniref:E3 ubiquitin-protein ligase RNF13-like isoform X1 n=1 Tax=Limulus polyphemus TaxID=6850 RepID=A0ABM1BKN9_LIMPO|nr:E3 ubiquitin-protein ligase RNF13-like isoform X1 [Limulus polyphemus]